jgi:cytochrome c5
MTKRLLWLMPLLLVACDSEQQGESRRAALPDPESEGAQLMKSFCSDCHAPPMPSTHTAKEWPNVVYRMQERRRTKAYPVMDEHEQQMLLSYLKQHSKS